MTTVESLLQDFDTEMANTRRTLERVPEDKADYRPHPKSMPLGKLAMHCATLPLFGAYIMQDDGMDMAQPTRPHVALVLESREQCLQRFNESAAQCRAAITAATDKEMTELWPFRYGQQVISNNSRLLSFRHLCLHHLIHHVAQLGVYFRLLDVPVPALYGPSADEQWTQS